MTAAVVLAGMIAAAMFALGVGALIGVQAEHSQRAQHLEALAVSTAPASDLRERFRQLAGRQIDQSNWGKRFAEQLSQADLQLAPSEFVALFIGAALVLTFLVAMLFSLHPFLDLFLGALFAFILARFLLESRRDRYLALLAAQIPDAALLISNSLKAGLSAPQALGVLANKMPRPAGVEFGRVVQEVRLGMPVDDAMRRMMERLPGEELSLLLTTIIIQRRAGGNLARALAVASAAITMRHRVRNEISTLTAEARFTSIVILLIPIFTLALLNQILPGAVTRLFSSIFGFMLLLVFVADVAFAFFLINRISNVRV